MALFALWRDDSVQGSADDLHRRLAAEAHIVPDVALAQAIDTPVSRWQVAAFACATHFYPPPAQIWHRPGSGLCVMQGVAWRDPDGSPRLVDAAGFAAMLDRADAQPDEAVRGEYAVARLLPDGTLLAFTDRTGVHQLFHRPGRPHMLASRAAFLALLADDWTPDEEAGLWLATIGYRVGQASGWRGVRQLAGDEMIVDAGIEAPPRRAARFDAPRGMAAGGEELLGEGIAQAKAAIRLAAGDAPVELPVTGGKDSRAVLALCLAAGLGEQLTLVTRGVPGHPDVVAAETIAHAIGRPHRRDPPRADPAPGDAIDGFVAAMQAHVYQTDGGMGGWDLLVGERAGTATMLTGHLGEVLKGVGKGASPGGDVVAMVRGQAPFDPMGLLRPAARAGLEDLLHAQAADMIALGADHGDLPDLFYFRNRVPNWLGGIRGVRAHEAQPIMPLGAPALLDLAFRLPPAERAAERIHFNIIEACAPALLALPFAHQRWSRLLAGAPGVAPLLAPADLPLFGNWQWRINHSPALRLWLRDFFLAQDILLWAGIDRALLADHLLERRFDYRDAIALFGIIAAAFHQSGSVRTHKIGGTTGPIGSGRPIRAVSPVLPARVEAAGHVDAVSGMARRVGDTISLTAGRGSIEIGGWAWTPAAPGAAITVSACADGREIARAEASGSRPDLRAAGIGGGDYGFTLRLDAAQLAGAARLVISHGGSPIASFALVDQSLRP